MNTKPYTHYLFPPLALVLLSAIMFAFPIGSDWPAYSASLEQIQTPYSIPRFVGMPFVFFVLPHALVDIDTGNAINLALNIIVIAAVAWKLTGRNWWIAFLITMSSPMGIQLLMSNNIDWLPLSSFLVADWIAYPLLAMKPQMLGGAAIIRFKRNPNPLHLIPLLGVLIASIVIWGAWWQHIGGGLMDVKWNFAPFPYLIPVGCWLLWQAWKTDDEIIAACATCFFVPYFAPYSVAGIHVLLASKYRKVAIWLWVFSWYFVVIASRRM